MLLNFHLQEIIRRKEKRDKARAITHSSQPKQIVILDTNALFTQRLDQIFNSEVDAIFMECRKYTSLKVIIPRVALLERLFQKMHETTSRFNTVQRELDSLSTLIQYRLDGLDTPVDLRRHLYRKALEWCVGQEVNIVRTPVRTINWNAVIRAAIWREAPFSPYDPEPKRRTEKGFRDAMILETVNQIARETKENNIAFICQDQLLRDTAKKQNENASNFSVHASLIEFLSAVKLENADVSRLLADVLVKQAPRIFYDPGSSDCLYNVCGIPDRIEKGFGVYLYYSHTLTDLEHSGTSEFIPLTDEKIRVGSTSFVRIDQAGRYNWQTQVAFVRGFKGSEDGPDQMRGALFGANWSCNFTGAGIYSNVELGEVEFLGVITKTLPRETVSYYDLERETDLLLDKLSSELMKAGEEII